MPKKGSSTTSFDIDPLRAIGPVKFGAKRTEVSAVLGAPDSGEYDDVTESYREKRSGAEFVYEKDKLTQVNFEKRGDIRYKELNLFETPNILEMLMRDDPGFGEQGGYANFPKLGMFVGGFGKRRVKEGKLVTVYGKKSVEFFKVVLTC